MVLPEYACSSLTKYSLNFVNKLQTYSLRVRQDLCMAEHGEALSLVNDIIHSTVIETGQE